MKFPKATTLIGTPEFKDTFMEELVEQEGELPLERLCGEGFPDAESVYLEFQEVEPTDTGCRVRVSCKFKELVPTGCADITFSRSGGFGVFEITVDKDRVYAEIELDHGASIEAGSRDYDC